MSPQSFALIGDVAEDSESVGYWIEPRKRAAKQTCMVLHLEFGGATIENVSISDLDSAAVRGHIQCAGGSILSNWSRTSSNNAPHLNMFTS